MDDLFALEGELPDNFAATPTHYVVAQQQQQQQEIVLRDNKSYEDPVLIKDSRILKNILSRQDDLSPSKNNYFESVQTEIKPHMRKIVTDWMLEVCEEQQCQAEVFCMAVNYMDRFLSQVNISKSQFQLVGCVCIFVASKFKETAPVPAENLVIYTDNSVTTLEIIQWELLLLNVLQWDLSAVTPYGILDQLLRTLTFNPATFDVNTVRKHSETFVALAATEYSFHQRSPAIVAVACLGAALRGLNASGLDAMLSSLQFTTGVQIDIIKECMAQVELSISLSMSGSSFQPSESTVPATVPVVAPNNQTTPKVIPQKQQEYYGSHQQSATTPTDIMDVACVY